MLWGMCIHHSSLGGCSKHVVYTSFRFVQILPSQMHCLVDPGSKVCTCVYNTAHIVECKVWLVNL